MTNYFEFWQHTQKELAEIPLDISRKIIDYPLDTIQVEQVSFLSLLGERIYGYVLLPKSRGPHPVVIECLGYMNHIQEPWQFAHWAQVGCACLVIDNRGQGGLTKDSVPYQTVWHEEPLGRGFLSVEDWYQRRLYADHLRSVEVIRTFDEIDQDKVLLRGGSQRGGIVLMVNSLTPHPILATFADVPSHSSLAKRIKDGTGSYHIITRYLSGNPEAQEKVERVLPYYDTQHFVSKIKNPVYTSVGSADPICPMTEFFPTYHNLKTKKELLVYWNKGHGGGEAKQIRKEMSKIKQILHEVRV